MATNNRETDDMMEDFVEDFSVLKAAREYYRAQHHSYSGYDYDTVKADEFAREAHATLRLVRTNGRG